VSNSDRDAARRYHEVTKHSYTSVRSDPHALDWENRPLAYKIYPAAGSIALPRELDLSPLPALPLCRSESCSTSAISSPRRWSQSGRPSPQPWPPMTRLSPQPQHRARRTSRK